MARDSRGWRNILLESKIQDGLSALYDDDDDDDDDDDYEYDNSGAYHSINFVWTLNLTHTRFSLRNETRYVTWNMKHVKHVLFFGPCIFIIEGIAVYVTLIRDCHRPYPDQLLPIKNSYLIYVKITDEYFNLQLNFNFLSF